MKERLKQEIEREAPFDVNLPKRILDGAVQKRRINWSMVSASAGILTVAIVFIFFLPIMKEHEPSSLAPTEISKIKEVTAYGIDSFMVKEDTTSFAYLKTLLNSINWENAEPLDFQRQPYEFVVQTVLENGQPYEYKFKVWDFFDNVDRFLFLESDFGIATIKEYDYYELISIIQSGPAYDFYANLDDKRILSYAVYNLSPNDNLAEAKELEEIIKRIDWIKRDDLIEGVTNDTVLKLRVGKGGYYPIYTTRLAIAALPEGIALIGAQTYGYVQPYDLLALQRLIDFEVERSFILRTPKDNVESTRYDEIIEQFTWNQYEIIDNFTMIPRYTLAHKGELYHIIFHTSDEEALVVRSSQLSKAYRMPNAREIKEFATSLTLNTLKQVEDILLWHEGAVDLPEASHTFQFAAENRFYEGAINLADMGVLKITEGDTVRWAEFDSVLYDSLALIDKELSD